MKRIMVPADDLLRLIEPHDCWAGAMPVEAQDLGPIRDKPKGWRVIKEC